MSEPITDYGRIIAQLASETDPHKREQLGRMLANRLEHAFGQSVDTAQAVRWETEEWLRQRMGETNDLISQLNQNQVAVKSELSGGFDALHQALAAFRSNQEAAVGELRSGFQQVAEAVNEMSEDVAVLKEAGMRQEKFNNVLVTRIDGIGTRMEYLEAGQAALVGRVDQQDMRHKTQIDELSRKVGETNTRLDESVADRATIHQEIEAIRALLAEFRADSADRRP